MNQNDFDLSISGARELTEEELTLIQGGNIFGDAWNAVKGAAADVVDAVTHPVQTLGRIASSSIWGKIVEIISRPPTRGPFGL